MEEERLIPQLALKQALHLGKDGNPTRVRRSVEQGLCKGPRKAPIRTARAVGQGDQHISGTACHLLFSPDGEESNIGGQTVHREIGVSGIKRHYHANAGTRW